MVIFVSVEKKSFYGKNNLPPLSTANKFSEQKKKYITYTNEDKLN